MSKHFKMIGKEFFRSFGRFVAVVGIVAVGVGFLIGIMQATPDMRYTMDEFYDSRNAYDVQVKSVVGLYPDDLEEIRALEQVESAEPFDSVDAEIGIASSRKIGRFYALSFENAQINRLDLVGGRYPNGYNECVVERGNDYLENVEIGQKITITDTSAVRGKFDAILDENGNLSLTVTGIVQNPMYYARSEYERTTMGNGRVGAVLYMDKGAIGLTSDEKMLRTVLGYSRNDPVYTDCFVTVRGAKQEEVFTEAYDDRVISAGDAIETLYETQAAKKLAVLDRFIDSVGGAESPTGEQLGKARELYATRWYTLDRTKNVSYASLNLNIDKVSGIAGIFPVFFILVAALVALTTMTKMVEDDRTQIGTLKALGYSKARILAKYLLYCGTAVVLGCGLGILCGFALLPNILWQAYESMYFLPALSMRYSGVFIAVVFVVSLAATALVTIGASLKSLREKPAALMLPKAPKAGKRILLEQIGFFWNHLKFKHKAMLRNVFRYKKNMWMTILGVAGCTALIVAGFGIQDSVKTLTERQFDEIFRYNLRVSVADSVRNEALDDFSNDPNVRASLAVREDDATLHIGEEHQEVKIVTAGDRLGEFVRLCPRGTDEELPFRSDSVILTENTAKEYGIRVGDTVGFSIGSKRVEVAVTGITENYVDCYVYFHRAQYEKSFGDYRENLILYQTDFSKAQQDGVSETLLANSEVNGVRFLSQERISYDNLLDTMKLITLVLVACAGGLAIIVLYNLTNINIDERKKELATLKVLGYQPIEVAGYVYREAFLLAVIGMLIGLGLGAFLHWFIIIRIEAVDVMFGRGVSWLSYLISAVITLVFSAVVDLLMIPKLKRIRMVDSMKAND